MLGRVCRIGVCCLQSDQKAIVAFSSINHITLLVLIFIQGRNISLISTLLIIFVHGGISRILFFFIFIFTYISHSRFNYQNQGLNYFLGGVFLLRIIIILNFAVPLTIPFIRELLIIKRLLRFDKLVFFYLFFFVFFSCYFCLFILINSFHGKISFSTQIFLPNFFYILYNFLISTFLPLVFLSKFN